MLTHRCFLHKGHLQTSTLRIPPCLLRVFMKTPLHWTGEPPTTPPKLRSRDPNKPPAFRNSAWRHSQAGRVRDPSRYISLQRCKIKMQNLPVIHLQIIYSNKFYKIKPSRELGQSSIYITSHFYPIPIHNPYNKDNSPRTTLMPPHAKTF